MSFLLDTDICSAYLKNDQQVVVKVMLHFGGLHVSVVTVGELLTWARRAKAPPTRLQGVRDLVITSIVHDIDFAVATNLANYGLASWIKGLPSAKRTCSMLPWHWSTT